MNTFLQRPFYYIRGFFYGIAVGAIFTGKYEAAIAWAILALAASIEKPLEDKSAQEWFINARKS